MLHIGTALWRTKKLVLFLSQSICIPNRERRRHVTIGGCFDIFLVVLLGSEGSKSLRLQAQWGSAFLAVYVWGPLSPNRNPLHINESIRGYYINFFQWEINRTWWSNWGKIKALWTSGDSFPRSISIAPEGIRLNLTLINTLSPFDVGKYHYLLIRCHRQMLCSNFHSESIQ